MMPNNPGGPPPPHFPPPPHMVPPGFPFPGAPPPNMLGPMNPALMGPKPPMPMGMPGPVPMGLGFPPHGPLLHHPGHIPGPLGRAPIIPGAPLPHPGVVVASSAPVVRPTVVIPSAQTPMNSSSASPVAASSPAVGGKVNTIFVGNLCPSVDEQTIRAVFGTCGNVLSWKKMSTFGFCEYETVEQVKRAVRILNGFKLGDQELKIKMDEKTEKSAANQEAKESDEERDAIDVEARQKLESLIPESEKSSTASREAKHKEPSKEDDESEKKNKEKELERDKRKELDFRKREQAWEQREKDKDAERQRDWEKEERRSKAKEKEKMRYLLENYQSDSEEDEKMSERYFRSHRDQLRRKWKRDRYDDQSLIAEDARRENEKQQRAIYLLNLKQQQEQQREASVVPSANGGAPDSQYQSGESNIHAMSESTTQEAGEGENGLQGNGGSEQSKMSLPSSSFSLSLKRGASQGTVQVAPVVETVQKKRSLSDVFNPDDPDDIDPLFRRKSNLELDERKSELTYATNSTGNGDGKGKSQGVAQGASAGGNLKLTPEEMKKIIDRIPNEKEPLFNLSVDWAVATRGDIMDKLRVWISKKINEYLGMMDESITNIVAENLKNHISPENLVSELEGLLDNEAERFVMMLWRKMIFEVYCVIQA